MDGLQLKYFVLKPKSKHRGDPYAYASRCALIKYAEIIDSVDQDLAEDLVNWTDEEAEYDDSLQPLEDF